MTTLAFALGQTVTVLTDDGFLFVGTIICCDEKFECKECEDRKHHDDDPIVFDPNIFKNKEDRTCDRFLVLELVEDVNVGGPPGPAVVAFEEGDTVLINFCQIIAISAGFPPTTKGKGA